MSSLLPSHHKGRSASEDDNHHHQNNNNNNGMNNNDNNNNNNGYDNSNNNNGNSKNNNNPSDFKSLDTIAPIQETTTTTIGNNNEYLATYFSVKSSITINNVAYVDNHNILIDLRKGKKFSLMVMYDNVNNVKLFGNDNRHITEKC